MPITAELTITRTKMIQERPNLHLRVVMPLSGWIKSFRRIETRIAWSVAIGADALQLGLFPLFAPGFASPAASALDVIVAFVLTKMLGWHWAFLPSFASELIPGLDLFPTWTAAVWFVTRKEVKPGEPEILPPESARSRQAF